MTCHIRIWSRNNTGVTNGDPSLVRFEPDPRVEAIVGSWPAHFEVRRLAGARRMQWNGMEWNGKWNGMEWNGMEWKMEWNGLE